MRFQFTIIHIPGKELVIADALSQSPLKHFCKTDEQLQADCDAYMNLTLNSFPATGKRLKQLQQAQEEDETCKLLFRYCKEGWPSKLHGSVKQFKSCSAKLSIQNGLLLRGHPTIYTHRNTAKNPLGASRHHKVPHNRCGGLVSVNKLKKQFRNVSCVANTSLSEQNHYYLLFFQITLGKRWV